MSNRREELQAIHARILQGDPIASSDLYNAIHRPIVGVLVKAFGPRRLSVTDAVDLATDAIVEYLSRPDRFDPSKSSLFTYLTTIARCDALNRLAANKRNRELISRFVELERADGNIFLDKPDDFIDAARIMSRFCFELVDDETDAAVLKLMILGEKSTEFYVEAMGITGLSPEDQTTAVKQRRDKLEKRLLRLRGRL